MKMAGCMEDEGLPHPKGETTSGITLKNQVDLRIGSKGYNKHKWGQRKLRPPSIKEKSVGKHNKNLSIPPMNIEKYLQMSHVFHTFLHFPLKELNYTMKFTI